MTSTLIPPAAAGISIDELIATLKEAATTSAAMTASQAAAYLSISKPSLYRGIARGEIPAAVQTAGGPRFRKRDLDRYLDGLRPQK